MFLDTAYKFVNRQHEEQEGVMSAMIKKMQKVAIDKPKEEEQKPEDLD